MTPNIAMSVYEISVTKYTISVFRGAVGISISESEFIGIFISDSKLLLRRAKLITVKDRFINLSTHTTMRIYI